MWKTIIASWAAALMLGWTPASAQMAAEAELTGLVARSKPFQEMMIESQGIFLEALDHINKAIEHSQKPLSKAEAEKWSAAWETGARARLAAVKQRLATTPRITAEEVRAVLGPEDNGEMGAAMAKAPKLIEDTLAAADSTVNETARYAPLAAAGDEAAIDKLAGELFAAGLYVVEIENQGLRSAINSLAPGHPQKSLAQSILSTNLAAMEIQRVSLRSYKGEPLEGAAAAVRARTHLADAETAARRMPAEATAMMDTLKDPPPEARSFVDKMRKAFDTYAASSKVELEAIGPLNEAASALAREDMDAVDAAIKKLDGAYDRRIALQMERSSYLGQ